MYYYDYIKNILVLMTSKDVITREQFPCNSSMSKTKKWKICIISLLNKHLVQYREHLRSENFQNRKKVYKSDEVDRTVTNNLFRIL